MTTEIGKEIRLAREQKRWSQAALAEKSGTKQQIIDRIERGETKFSRAIPAIHAALGLNNFSQEVRSSLQNRDIEHENIPIYYVKSELDDKLYITHRIITLEQRPNSLTSLPEAYGLQMRGSSMSPIIRSGEFLLCHPLQPVSFGDRAVFRTDDPNSEIVIAELVEETRDLWRVKNSRGELSLDKSAFPSAHVIVATLKS